MSGVFIGYSRNERLITALSRVLINAVLNFANWFEARRLYCNRGVVVKVLRYKSDVQVCVIAEQGRAGYRGMLIAFDQVFRTSVTTVREVDHRPDGLILVIP